MKKIMVVEDDLNLGTALVGFLEMQKYEVHYVSNGDEAIAEFQQFEPDLVTLDVMLNCSIDGFGILAMASVFPILSVQAYGFLIRFRQRHAIRAMEQEAADE